MHLTNNQLITLIEIAKGKAVTIPKLTKATGFNHHQIRGYLKSFENAKLITRVKDYERVASYILSTSGRTHMSESLKSYALMEMQRLNGLLDDCEVGARVGFTDGP